MQVWLKVRHFIHVPVSDNLWTSFVNNIKTIAHKRSTRVVVAKLLFGATVYYIWQERNKRLYKKKARQVDQVFELIFKTTRLKLMSLILKDSDDVARIRIEWNIARNM